MTRDLLLVRSVCWVIGMVCIKTQTLLDHRYGIPLFTFPVPYLSPVSFAGLLIPRERRDDHKCANKYKDAWKRYCDRVPSRIIPYVY